MKHLLIFLLIIVTSCNEKLKEDNNSVKISDAINETEKSHQSEFNLLNTVLDKLNLSKKQCKTDLITSRENPMNENETIMVIPEIVEDEEYYFELDGHILIVNTNTGEIKQQYFESSATNEWLSDGVVLKEIKIDTAPYFIDENTRAFGIRVYYEGDSRSNPFNNETISLFVKSGDNLKKVLKNFGVMEYGGERVTDCLGEFLLKKKTLIMTSEKTNNYFDINVKITITEIKNFINENDDCDTIEEVQKDNKVLKFQGEEYKLIEYENVGFNDIINEIQFKTQPIVDSTNFDNTNVVKHFNLISVNNLQLVKIYPHFYSENYNYKASSSYRIDLSNNFHTVVLNIHKGENEMESVLINYKLNGELIDYKVISYDEIAEGWSRIESNIEDNRITIKNILWIDEKQETIEIFNINENGNIIPHEIK